MRKEVFIALGVMVFVWAVMFTPMVAHADTFVSGITTDAGDVGTDFLAMIQQWIKGNIGKLIAVFAVLGGVLSFVFKRDVAGFVYGLFGGALVGGILGLAALMFETGSKAFGATVYHGIADTVQYSIDFIKGVVTRQ